MTKTRTNFELGGHVPPMDPPLVSDYVNIYMQWLQSWHPAVDVDPTFLLPQLFLWRILRHSPRFRRPWQ